MDNGAASNEAQAVVPAASSQQAVSPVPASIPSAWACGHPKTEENTQRVGVAGVRCRQCRRRITREHHRRVTGFYPRNPLALKPCEFCGSDMVQTSHDSWECGHACPVSIGVMGELEWDAKARREWRKFIADERLAQGIETGTDETRSGSVSEADESPVACDAPNSSRPTQEDRSDGN